MKLRISAFLLICMIMLTVLLGGCGKNGGTIDEPEITVDYLTNEYADQLMRDGAEQVLGSLSITKQQDDTLSLTIASKVIVNSSDYEDGYYVADKNDLITLPLDPEVRIVCIKGKDNAPNVATIEDLKKTLSKDLHGNTLYDVYTMEEQTLLILVKEL